jgi:hypothetical protein
MAYIHCLILVNLRSRSTPILPTLPCRHCDNNEFSRGLRAWNNDAKKWRAVPKDPGYSDIRPKRILATDGARTSNWPGSAAVFLSSIPRWRHAAARWRSSHGTVVVPVRGAHGQRVTAAHLRAAHGTYVERRRAPGSSSKAVLASIGAPSLGRTPLDANVDGVSKITYLELAPGYFV